MAWDDGSGSRLFVGGGFRILGVNLWPFAIWDGSSWVYPDGGLITPATNGDLWIADEGTLPTLYSQCQEVDTPAHAFLRRKWLPPAWVEPDPAYNGPNGFPVLSQLQGGQTIVYGLIPDLPHDVQSGRVAQWTGVEWVELAVPPGARTPRDAMVIYNDGSGPALHAALSGQVAKWDGASWATLGANPPPAVSLLRAYDAGSGPELYASGACSAGWGGVIRWNGKNWGDVGGGLGQVPLTACGVSAMEVFDDGSGAALFVAGQFNSAGGAQARNIAKWDGRQWHALGAGLTAGAGISLAVYDDGRGLSLFVGGYDNLKAGAGVTPVLAQWVGCIGQCYPDCNNDGTLNVMDFGCLQTKYVTLDPYSDCNADGQFTVADFGCFQTKFVSGCP